MKKETTRLVTRRQAIVAGLASMGGVVLARPKTLPPTYGSLLRLADNVTYVAHRALLPQDALVREYSEKDITPFPAIVTTNARVDVATWRLSVEGLVARPQTFSLADLKRLPARTQITRHTCEEGWSAIGATASEQRTATLQGILATGGAGGPGPIRRPAAPDRCG